MNKDERKSREREEFKFFVLCIVFLLAVLFFLFGLRSEARAEEVLVAEAPFNVGGNDDSSNNSSFIIDLDNGGSYTDLQSLTANLSNDYNAARKFNFINSYVPSDDAGINIIYADGSDQSTKQQIGPGDELDKQNAETGSVDDIYVPDSDDDCPVSSAVPLAVELQEYLWTKAKKATSDYKNYYAFLLGVMEHESTFRPSATHHNSNGSIDRGIMQINSSNIGKMKKAGLISSGEEQTV